MWLLLLLLLLLLCLSLPQENPAGPVMCSVVSGGLKAHFVDDKSNIETRDDNNNDNDDDDDENVNAGGGGGSDVQL